MECKEILLRKWTRFVCLSKKENKISQSHYSPPYFFSTSWFSASKNPSGYWM